MKKKKIKSSPDKILTVYYATDDARCKCLNMTKANASFHVYKNAVVHAKATSKETVKLKAFYFSKKLHTILYCGTLSICHICYSEYAGHTVCSKVYVFINFVASG